MKRLVTITLSRHTAPRPTYPRATPPARMRHSGPDVGEQQLQSPQRPPQDAPRPRLPLASSEWDLAPSETGSRGTNQNRSSGQPSISTPVVTAEVRSDVVSGNSPERTTLTELIPCTGDPNVGVHVLSGPGGRAFSQEFSLELAVAFSSRAGRVALNQHRQRDAGEPVLNSFLQSLTADRTRTTAVVVQAQGQTRAGIHETNLDGEYIPTRRIFQQIAAVSSHPVEVVLTCREGADALGDSRALPAGSCVVALSPTRGSCCSSSSGGISHADMERFVEALRLASDAPLNARSMLLTYCAGLQNRNAPSIWTNGCQVDLDSVLMRRLGVQFSSAQLAQIHHELDALIEPARIDEVARKISTGTDGAAVPALDYGVALAIITITEIPITNP